MIRLLLGIAVGILLIGPGAFGAPKPTPPARNQFVQKIGPEEWSKLQVRYGQLNGDIAVRGILPFTKEDGTQTKLLTGYAYKEFYDWDLYFENIYLAGYGINDYCFSNFQEFLDRQQPDGFVSRTLKSPRKTQDFKPFLAQIAVLGSRQRGNNFEWLRGTDYDRLKKYLDRWFQYDSDHNGLPVWNSSDASGMDNQVSRAGNQNAFQDEGVDLACYLARELQAMAIIAGRLGRKDDQRAYLDHARLLSQQINEVCWDDKDGFYYDRNEKTGKRVFVKSVAGFTPLWAGIAPPERAARLVKEHLLNPKEFWLQYPVASYAATEPDFYEGRHGGECNWHGTAWIPTNYMIFHGLLRYGFHDAAKQLADKTFHMALDENPATREYYDSDTGRGNGMNPFWGWSSLAYQMPLECLTGYDPTDLNGPVRPILSDLGIPFAAETKG